MLQKYGTEQQTIYRPQRAKQAYSPASTFKIPNTLIALKYGLVNSPDSVFKWDGQKRWLDIWNQDQTLRSAYQVSCVWCYQSLARKLGSKIYKKELTALNYGNHQLGNQIDQFWLDGSLSISALQQVGFLIRLIDKDLPFTIESQRMTKQIMREDRQGEYGLYAKSGWAAGEINIGWYVGYVEASTGVWVFAMNMDLQDPKRAPLRQKVVMQALSELGII